MTLRSISWATFLAVVPLVAGGSVTQEPDAPDAPKTPIRLEVIKKTQNPLTRELGSLSLENTFSFGVGESDEFGYGLLIKPRFPVILSDRWALINRSSLPVFSVPGPIPDAPRTSGLGDLLHTALLSPSTGRRVIWGLGPTVGFPTATDELLGSGKWLLGPAAIFVYAPRRSVFGVVVQNLWSVGGDAKRPEVNALSLRPLVNINLPMGWFIVSKPNISANWRASGDRRWLIEAGGGIGKVFRIGNLGFSFESQFFGYPVRPEGAATWTARFEMAVLFRRGALRNRAAARAQPKTSN